MLRVVKNDLSGRTASIIKNDRAALKKQKVSDNQTKQAGKVQINNVISIIPFLKRNTGVGGGFSA